jgi:transcriptional regulator with XRE-family HTH domain
MKKNKKINELFGEKVRFMRMSKGLSQEELGHQCGLHRTYIGQIERAEKNISLQNIYKIANTFDIEIKELFEFGDIYKENANNNGKKS